jgi:hypothetical protein
VIDGKGEGFSVRSEVVISDVRGSAGSWEEADNNSAELLAGSERSEVVDVNVIGSPAGSEVVNTGITG